VIELPLAMPADVAATVIDVVAPGLRRTVSLQPGADTVLRLPVDIRRPWIVSLRTRRPFWIGSRLLAAEAGTPRIIDEEAPNER
jgi:hypothetical protein